MSVLVETVRMMKASLLCITLATYPIGEGDIAEFSAIRPQILVLVS